MLRLLLQVQWAAGMLIENLSRFGLKQQNCSCSYPLWKACGSGAAWEGRARVNVLPSHGHQLAGDAVGVLKDREPFLGCSAVSLCRKSMD